MTTNANRSIWTSATPEPYDYDLEPYFHQAENAWDVDPYASAAAVAGRTWDAMKRKNSAAVEVLMGTRKSFVAAFLAYAE